jgi:hypothetical protein
MVSKAALRSRSTIIKFSDDTTVVGLINNTDETAYRVEVRALGVWCQENNLSLNVSKTKEMIVDFRKQQRENPPIHIDGTAMEKVERFKFLGVHITDKLKWCGEEGATASLQPQEAEFFFACHRKPLLTFTGAQSRASCWAVSLPTATAPPTTTGLSRGWCGLHNTSRG